MQPIARSCAPLMVCLLLGNPWTSLAWAQDSPPKLEIVIVEGEGAVNNVRDRVSHDPVVQVQDENHKPVAGAAVVFFLPNQGPGGTFFDGSKSMTVTTDAQGRAVARGIQFNRVSGQMQIRVTASSGGQTATATITQNNVAGSTSAGMSTTVKVILIVALAAGAAAGAIVATRGGSSSSSSSTIAPPISITAGTPTVGAP
jgi:hypothetical protein